MSRRFVSTSVMVLALIWLGLLIGVSFLATPIKFAAPSLDLPVALDVGRHTFALFNRIEIGLGLALLFATIAGLRRPGAVWPLALMLVVLAGQTFWLLPALDERVETIMQGGMPPASPMHSFYVGAEVVKLLCLVALAWAAGKQSAFFAPLADLKE